MGHEATVSKVSADQLFLPDEPRHDRGRAMAMVVRGFVEPIAKASRWSTRSNSTG